MKVLWFTNVPFPAACEAVGRRPPVTGGWLPSLAAALQATRKVEIEVISLVVGGGDESPQVNGCRHNLIAIEPRHFATESWFYPSARVRQKCCDIVEGFRPDVVHVHGSENSFGLLTAKGDIQTPAVISLQGLLGPYSRFDSGGISVWDRMRHCTISDLVGRHGSLRGSWLLSRRIWHVESCILRSRAVFIGRTLYDRACLRAVNPHAVYHHCDEVMRLPFYTQQRDPHQVIPGHIFAPVGGYPRKGFHCLLKAVALLKDEFPNLAVRLPGAPPVNSWLGDGYQRHVYGLIRTLGLENHVTFLGDLDAEAVADELARAQVFAFPSFADNSPNSLAEAMLVGAPVVASFVGGVPSMVCDQETALCFPVGDEIVMAECLRKALSDESLSARLAHNAQQVARQRHDPNSIAHRMLEIYALAAST